MPEKISIFKKIARFFTGVKNAPGDMLKRRAARRQMLQGRLKDCDAFLFSITPIINGVPEGSRKALQSEHDALEHDFDYVCKHFHTSTPELDKRLEIIAVKARTLKIHAACLAAMNSPQYAESKRALQDILEGISNLRQNVLNHEYVTSADLIAYKQELTNLETKTHAHIEFDKLK